jgi:ABC-2 type transport system ATP-binding protein
VLWATHLIEEVREDDHVLILHQGQLLADGTGHAICKSEGTRDLAETFHTLTGAG